MVWHLQNVPEKVLGTSSILIGANFDALFSKNFCKTIFNGRSSRVFLFGVEERGKEKNSLWLCHGIRTKSIMNHRSFLIKSELSGRI